MGSVKAILVILVSPLFSSIVKAEFEYEESSGRGPSRWGQLDPNWRSCGDGRSQSPIDLVDQDVQILPSLGPFQSSYQQTLATIINTGHAIMVTWKDNAGFISINQTNYQLKQCHWHIPTEHAINGIRYDLELHIFHQTSDGKIAVVGILYQIGRSDPFILSLSSFIEFVTKEEREVGNLNPNEIGSLSGNYYRYIGSLTTPPCTEGVVWTVFQEVRQASMEQVEALREALRSTSDEGIDLNARPIQQLNGRPVLLYQP